VRVHLPIAAPARAACAGGRGGDVAVLGGGEDAFVWDLGDDNDVIEG
jgi:hypothetical protein